MLIEIPSTTDKKLTKLVKNINKDYERGNFKKFPKYLLDIIALLEINTSEANILLFILSILAEERPEDFNPSSIKAIFPFLQHTSIKERLNSIIIVGSYFLHRITDNLDIDLGEIASFLHLLEDPEGEIRQNISFFLEQFPETMDNQLLLELDLFLKVLSTETHIEVINAIEKILLRLQPKMSLSILCSYVSTLIQAYHDSKSPERSDTILKLLELEIPKLKNRSKKKFNKKEIEKIIKERIPLIRLTDLNELADAERLNVEKVEDYLTGNIDENKIYYFLYTEKNHKKMLEFEKQELQSFLAQEKLKIEEIIATFKHVGISHSSIVAVLLRDLLAKHIIEGVLSKKYFYSWNYLKNDLSQHLRRRGVLNYSQFESYLDKNVFHKIIESLATQTSFKGVFNSNKDQYFTFNAITKEIESIASKDNVVDLKIYRKKYGQESFYLLEDYCRKNFFTPYQSDHIWLTNLGKTRIQQVLHTCEQIGEFNLIERSKEMKIPEVILLRFTKEQFEHKNGFWNKDQSQFFYAKAIKKRINKIQMEPIAEKRNILIESLAEELQIEKEEIARKVDEKLHKLKEVLQNKEEFEIKPVIRDLQMDYKEFIAFVNDFEKPYLIVNNKIIFSPKKIQEEENNILNIILRDSKIKSQLSIEKIASRLRCADKIILSSIKKLIEDKNIDGVWIKEDKIFLTEKGIQNRMLESKTYIDMQSFIEEITPSEDDILLFEKILSTLLEKGALKGVYDSEMQIFQSTEVAGEANLIAERDRFKKEVTPLNNDLDRTYNILREIFMGKDLNPAAIDEYEQILEENIRKILNNQTFIKRLINNANHRLNRHISSQRPRRNQKGSKQRRHEENKSKRISFEEDEVVANIINDFENWKTLIIEIEQKAGQIVFLKKKLKNNPEDPDSKTALNGILEYIGFID
ncbi:hypothetical protein NEF87_004387 [Candidatus Lokiarchaeum ossiferum]|uniref:Uncharacterized protein n=1 Tax=Candidatus Lokiarchaeum ossiferum TaxID=2951803 RepID=A0ABY6HZ00_9ARCH|nr:hypothetical protein NEF87_004387 [Candidatus Lokiarchaeum sp. B-35]